MKLYQEKAINRDRRPGFGGSAFLEELPGQPNNGVEIIAVVECADTPGRSFAKARGIRDISMDELAGMGTDIDILFDLANAAAVRQEFREEFREKLRTSWNRHTIAATENITRMIRAPTSGDPDLSRAHTRTG